MKNSILIKLIIISLFSRLSIADDTNQLYWPEADATEKMIPPIITMVQEELESIMEIIRE